VASAADRYAGYEEMVARVLARGGLELARKIEERRAFDSSEESSVGSLWVVPVPQGESST
jgi:hypothetical protein